MNIRQLSGIHDLNKIILELCVKWYEHIRVWNHELPSALLFSKKYKTQKRDIRSIC
jgi:hypothetical protein